MDAKVIGSRKRGNVVQLVVRLLDTDEIRVLDVSEQAAGLLLAADVVRLVPAQLYPQPSEN